MGMETGRFFSSDPSSLSSCDIEAVSHLSCQQKVITLTPQFSSDSVGVKS